MRIGNWPLVMLALEHIIKHADEYNQLRWRSSCGSVRCLGGWIAFFAGWRDALTYSGKDPESFFNGVNRTGNPADLPTIPIAEAALRSLELDPEIYGTEFEEFERSSAMSVLACSLFGAGLEFPDILATVRDLMKADGVTPTPLIEMEMEKAGVTSEWETW